MRIPNREHTSRPWRIHEVAADFSVEDVWALPVSGGAADFPALLEAIGDLDFPASTSRAVHLLWWARDQLGRWLDLGRISGPAEVARSLPIPGSSQTSLRQRLPAHLRGTARSLWPRPTPFVPLYRTDAEYAAELSNRTVHAVLHLAWVDRGDGCWRGQLAVLVKPRGRLGTAYMALIRPFRRAVVYPALLRQLERAWTQRQRRADPCFAGPDIETLGAPIGGDASGGTVPWGPIWAVSSGSACSGRKHAAR
jgi:hypothetical protein